MSNQLDRALRENDLPAAKRALALGANPNTPVWDGVHTPLYWAAKMRWEFVEPLVQAGAHVSAELAFETSSLHMVAHDPKLLKVVLDADAEEAINLLDTSHGRTPLMCALYTYGGMFHIRGAKAECTRLLLDAGADATVRSTSGYMALHLAAAGRDVEAVRLLLQAGADPLCSDFDSLGPSTAVGLARENEFPEGPQILRLLEDAARGPRRRRTRR
ncbi:MAG: ankyrin repeat domain-containing protein [Actinomycetota bacterium]